MLAPGRTPPAPDDGIAGAARGSGSGRPWGRGRATFSRMPNVHMRRIREVSTFRRLAAAAWRTPRDPSFHGSLEVDATAALAHLAALRERTGVRATFTHLVGRALAIVLRECPEVHVVIRGGRFYRREDVDIFFQVALAARRDLSGLVIRRADDKSIADIAREFEERLERTRRDRDAEVAAVRRRLAWMPALLLRPLEAALDVLQNTCNLRVPGLPRDPFGSAAVTNIGMFGARWGYAPLFPPAHWPIIVLVGAVQPRPWVVEEADGPRVAVRPILPLHATFDHRVIDGVQAAHLAARLEALLARPELLAPREAPPR